MMKSYAQNFEDVLLWRALKDVPHGFYVDLGAQHPVLDSVSRWFYEQGWRGIHVEPVAFYANLLRQDRPDEDVVEALISDEGGDHVIYAFPDTGLSTMSPQIAETHKADLGLEWEEQIVPSLTLSDLFARKGNCEVHWLKVDVEGQERAVLASWGDNLVRPWIVLVEATYPNTQIETHAEWEGLLTSRGYTFVYEDGLNRYYLHEAHEDLRDRFRYPPNYFDFFSLGEHWATADLRNSNRQAFEEVECRRRQAEEEKALATAQSDERDARLTAAVADRVNGQLAELAIQVAQGQESLKSQLTSAHHKALQIIEAERKAEKALELAKIEGIEALISGIQLSINRSDRNLATTNETVHGLVSRLDYDWRRLKEQKRDLAADFMAVKQELHELKSNPWKLLRALLQPRKEGLMRERRMSNTAPLWGESGIPKEATAKPEQGSDSLIDDTAHETVTLGQLYALPPVEFIRVSYRALLDREADHGGLSHYLSRMALGDSRLRIHQSIANGKEYRARAACSDLLTLEDEAFVEAAYRRILGRSADAKGRAHYLEKLRRGKPRAGVLKSLAQSTEAKSASQLSLRLRREIEASLSSRWRTFRLGWSARRLAQLDFTLSTAIQRIEVDIRTQLDELRADVGKRGNSFASNSIAEQVRSSSPRPRWVPRTLRETVTQINDEPAPRIVAVHADYRSLARRMRQEAPFGRLTNGQDGQRQFNDYLEANYELENHGGDIVRWIGAEAIAYLHVTGESFNVEAAGFFEERSVLVSFEGVVVGTLQFNKEQSVAKLPVGDWIGKDVAIRLRCLGTFNPRAAGVNSDQRDLGLLIRSIYFD